MEVFLQRMGGDILQVKLIDISRRIIYNKRVNVLDRRQIAQICEDLRAKYNIDVVAIMQEFEPEVKWH